MARLPGHAAGSATVPRAQVKRMNQSAQDVGTADNMVKKVEAILNEHYKTLQWIDAESSQLEGAVHELRELGIATQ